MPCIVLFELPWTSHTSRMISSPHLFGYQIYNTIGKVIVPFILSSWSWSFLFTAVYDVTIAYKHCCPTFMDNVFGVAPAEVHIHVRRISVDSIPPIEDEVNSWLIKTFHLKDQMLSDFHSQGHFPNGGTEHDLSTAKCLINFGAVILLTSICTYCTFFSSIWFKIYVSLACAYLTSATYFNIRPVPIGGLVTALFKCKLS